MHIRFDDLKHKYTKHGRQNKKAYRVNNYQ